MGKILEDFLGGFVLSALFVTGANAQNWSGVISSSRAINWANAGLPATLPDGETSANPWTPPARTTLCSTLTTSSFSGMSLSNYVTPTALNSALSSCTGGEAVYLSAGQYYFSGGITMGAQNNVTLRLDPGATINFNNGAGVSWENPSGGTTVNNAAWSAGYSAGTTSIALSSIAGLVAGKSIIAAYQCNDGTSGIPNCTSGSPTNGGGVYVCGFNGSACSTEGGPPQAQNQLFLVTGWTGSGPYTVTVSPAVYMANWSSSATPFASGYTTSYGDGLEGGTINEGTAGGTVYLAYTYGSWIMGTRIIGGTNNQTEFSNAKNCLMMSDYFYGAVLLNGNLPEPVLLNTDGDNLIMNNIFQIGSGPYVEGGSSGDVIAFNYMRDGFSNSGNETYLGNVAVGHAPGGSFFLYEGNELGSIQDDEIHGSHNLDTFFRNLVSANDPPYTKSSEIVAIMMAGYSRFENVVGNVLGSGTTTSYQSTPSSVQGAVIYSIGTWFGGSISDTMALQSAFRWGNWDAVTGAVRWCGNSSSPGWSTTCSSTSEVPTSLSGAAASFNNPVPNSTTLPASFFMPATAHPSGGTGLNWWKVCTAWTAFPTNCSASRTQPYPPIGPDVTGGTTVIGGYNYSGYAYDIPAAVAWQNLPIDTTYQSSYSITGSSWSGGVETLTISGLPGSKPPVGEFQVIGVAGCNGTFQPTTSTGTTVSYALTSNPGSCTGGSFLFPDIRQFSSAVYENDSAATSGGGSAPPPPTNLQVVTQ